MSSAVADREVAAIVAANACAQPGDVLIVAALPGTGKTTLLQRLAKESTEPTVYLMFNKKPCEEFRAWLTARSLDHVAAYTFHKLAFDCVAESGAALKSVDRPPEEVQRLMREHKVTSVPALLAVPGGAEVARAWYERAVEGDWSVTTDVLLHWLAHADAMPELQATPTFQRLRAARRLYVDEAQDCSADMVCIVKGCASAAASVVVAGDTNQHINSFMGAVDPIGDRARHFPGARVFPLTQTWRYHSQIADAFNSIARERCVGRPGKPEADKAPAGSTIVLCSTNREVDDALDQLRKRGLKAFKRGGDDGGAAEGIEVSTIHKAKGGGWFTVVVMPIRRRGDANMAATAVSRAREVLYVHRSLVGEYGVRTASHVRKFVSLRDISL